MAEREWQEQVGLVGQDAGDDSSAWSGVRMELTRTAACDDSRVGWR